MQTLSELIQSCEQQQGQLTAHIDDGWLQGRSVYGGVQAALAAQAMQPFSDDLPIRTLQATLCAPIPAGEIRIRANLLRSGKNTRQVEARIMDGEICLALFVGIFGRARDSQVAHDLRLPAQQSNPGVKMPYIEGRMPRFLQHFDAYLLHGHFPGTGKQDTAHVFRLTLKDQAKQTTLSQILSFSDFPPPVGLSWISGFTPGSTMTWMLNFTGHQYANQSLENWVIDVQLDSAQDCYTQQTVTLFAPDGYAIARGTQCMVIFA